MECGLLWGLNEIHIDRAQNIAQDKNISYYSYLHNYYKYA